MKSRVIFTMLVSFFICSCSSKEEKVHKLIQQELYRTLNDYSSYEPVEFGSLDSVFSTPIVIPEYKERIAQQQRLKGQYEALMSKYNASSLLYSRAEKKLILSELQTNVEVARSNKNAIDSIENTFTPGFMGYQMTHRYRASGSDGNLKLYNRIFAIDSLFQKATDVGEVK